MKKLFTYGTLQQENVQLETFGRKLKGTKATLTSYVVSQIKIKDKNVIMVSGSNMHPILKFTGNILDEVHGTVFDITKNELVKADKYEVEEYHRVLIKLKSGQIAWAYTISKEDFI